MTEQEPEAMMFFIIGGSASGKSEYAERLAERLAFSPAGGKKGGREGEQGLPKGVRKDGSSGRYGSSDGPERADEANRSDGPDGPVPLLYLATMQRDGEEALARIERHRKQREGRGFQLFEAPTPECLRDMPAARTVLLDCLSNFTANTMFSGVFSDADAEDYGGEDRRREGRTEEKEENETERGERIAKEITEQILLLRDRCEHLVVVADAVFSDGMVYDRETERYIRVLGRICAALAEKAESVTEVVFGLPVAVREPAVCGTGMRL